MAIIIWVSMMNFLFLFITTLEIGVRNNCYATVIIPNVLAFLVRHVVRQCAACQMFDYVHDIRD
jgi:hypothetical protein